MSRWPKNDPDGIVWKTAVVLAAVVLAVIAHLYFVRSGVSGCVPGTEGCEITSVPRPPEP